MQVTRGWIILWIFFGGDYQCFRVEAQHPVATG